MFFLILVCTFYSTKKLIGIAVAAHAVVAQLDEVPVAHLLRHPVADVDEHDNQGALEW